MAKSDKRIKFGLKCSVCSDKNYSTTKNKQNSADKLSFNRHCPRCDKHTLHKEVK